MSQTNPATRFYFSLSEWLPRAIERSGAQVAWLGRTITTTACVMTLALGAGAQAPVDPAGRGQIEEKAYPFSSIGFVETKKAIEWRSGSAMRPSRLSGSGFMISPCYALTAFHVVFGNDPAIARQAAVHSVWISFAGHGRRFALDRVPAKVVAWGDYAADPAQDWALLQVAGCPGGRADIGWLEFEPADRPIEDRIATVGGFSGRGQDLQLISQRECRLSRRMGRMTIGNECVGEPGMSGGPIMVRDADLRPRVAAIVSRRLPVFADPAGPLPPRLNLGVIVQVALSGGRHYSRILADRSLAAGLGPSVFLQDRSGDTRCDIVEPPSDGCPGSTSQRPSREGLGAATASLSGVGSQTKH